MAVTWRGSTGTPPILCFPESGQYVFAMVNPFRSRHQISVLEFIVTGVSIESSFSAGNIMPLLRVMRCAATAVSGGVEIVRRPAWDSHINAPGPHIKMLFSGYGASEANGITVAPEAGNMWQQYTQRSVQLNHKRRPLHHQMLPAGVSIVPGEAIIVQWLHGLNPVGGMSIFNIAWEEDEIDAGVTIGGTVTLAASPVEGAKVFVLTDSDIDMPAPELEIVESDALGEWATTVATGVKGAAFVQHRDGATLYTDEGKPYLEP